MLISFFKPNRPVTLLAILPVITLLLWIPGILKYPMPLAFEHSMPFFDALAFLCSQVPYSAPILSLSLIYLQALLLNHIVNTNDILKPKSNLPALMYVLIMSSVVELQTLHPVVISNIFLIIAISRICTIYNQNRVYSQVFDAGMFVALGSFFYFPAIAFFLFIWLSLLIIRPFIWREYIIALLGMLVPYLFLASWYFWTGEWIEFFKDKITDIDPSTIVFPNLVALDYGLVAYLLLLLFASLLAVFRIMGKNVVRVQYLLRSLVALLVVGFAILLFDSSRNLHTIALVAIPSSIIFANYFLVLKRRLLAEVIFTLLLLLIIFNLFTSH
ncbi:MAG: hypothetical protein H0X62_00745 [Bacteroidetes bacterium]|nr:hypothetical protein [Bacteroidota bacterium]